MEQILIPHKRAKELAGILHDVSKSLGCKIELKEENLVLINGPGYEEYNAKNVIQAFGRGFEMKVAEKLLLEDYFSKYVYLKDLFRNEAQIRRIKARVIGRNGRTKEYMQEVSGASISIYGNTIGVIGTVEQIDIAVTALNVLLKGGTHKKAYRIMERKRRNFSKGEREIPRPSRME